MDGGGSDLGDEQEGACLGPDFLVRRYVSNVSAAQGSGLSVEDGAHASSSLW